MPKQKFLRPHEVLDAFPEIASVWNAQQIGNLRNLKLIDGYRIGKISFVKTDDVLAIFEYYNQQKTKP